MTKKMVSVIAVTMLLCLTIMYAATTGSVQISYMEFITGLFDGTDDKMAAIRDLRFPRILVAVFAGAALSVLSLIHI